MASIVKRKSKYSVVYTCLDENGVKRQRWETFASNAEAKKRKAQIEYQQSTGTFIAPTAKTIRELLEEYIAIYGINAWALSTYESRRGLIDNYINPIIGDMKLEQATPRVMDQFYKNLLTVKAKPRPYQSAKNEYLSPRTVKEIHKILRNAFNQAVKWELISRNPVINATLPKCEAKPRDIWTADTLFHALELCDDDINRALNKLITEHGLPKVVFHSLRHSSITYKLKLNGGDMKSVQGDSGHAQMKMVADVYSHIIDEDRRLNARRFEEAFYSGHKTEEELDGLHVHTIEEAASLQPAQQESDQELLMRLLTKSPEMAALIKTLAKSL